MELDLVAFVFLAFVALLLLIILIVSLGRGQDDIKRSVNHLFFSLCSLYHGVMINNLIYERNIKNVLRRPKKINFENKDWLP